MLQRDDGVLRLRLVPSETISRLETAFGANRATILNGREFVLRDWAPSGALEYELHGRVEEDPDGSRIVLSRRLHGGLARFSFLAGGGSVLSLAFFAGSFWQGRRGLIESIGALLLWPAVLVYLAQALRTRLAAAHAALDPVRERVVDHFADVRVRFDEGPYR